MIKQHIIQVLYMLCFFALFSCNQRGSSPETAAKDSKSTETALSQEQQSLAAQHFATYCAGCHGDNATTFADRDWKFGESDEALFASIKKGRPDMGMPAFEATFSDEEIKGLVSYIRQGMEHVAEYDFEDAPTTGGTFQTEELQLKLETVAEGFGEVPWGMAFLPDGSMLITEIGGTLYCRSPDGSMQKVSGTPEVVAQGQGGLLDVVLHPNFASNQLIYLSYSAPKGGDKLTTAVMRARLQENVLSDQQEIFEAKP